MMSKWRQYPALASNFIPYSILLDLNRRVTRMYRANAIPTTFVFDRRGTQRAVLSGSRGSSAFEPAILPLLLEKP